MRCRCFHCILLWERSLLPDGGCDCLSGVITRMRHSKLHSQGQQVQGPSSVMPERGATGQCCWEKWRKGPASLLRVLAQGHSWAVLCLNWHAARTHIDTASAITMLLCYQLDHTMVQSAPPPPQAVAVQGPV